MTINRSGHAAGRLLISLLALSVLAGGITFASLQSQNATSLSNTISSATASLQIANSQGTFGSNAPGFNFNNVEPGGAASAAQTITLKNNGSLGLNLQLTINKTNLINNQGADLQHVYVLITPTGGSTPTKISIADLLNGYTSAHPMPLNLSLAAGATSEYQVQIQMDSSAVSGTTSGVSITGMDLIFSGSTGAA